MEMVLACRNHPDVVDGLRYCSRCGQAFCPDCLVNIRGNSYCATCKGEQLLDLSSGVDHNVLELAGIGRRFGALTLRFSTPPRLPPQRAPPACTPWGPTRAW